MKEANNYKKTKLKMALRVIGVILLICLAIAEIAWAKNVASSSALSKGDPWWMWPAILFVFTFTIGLIAPVSGVGGGVLFVPITTAFFPFSVDFIRGTGLVMAMCSAISSTPTLAKKGLASLKVMAPVVVVSMAFSIIGGIVGLWITNAFPTGKYYIDIALGIILWFIFYVMLTSKKVEFPEVTHIDNFSRKLGMKGEWYEPNLDEVVEYHTTRFFAGVPTFALVGFIAGMFGLGAGWANVPVLNLIMGAPIKVATSTSMMIITLNDAAAAWVYLSKGAMLPLIVVPSVVGISIGARIGAKLAVKAKPKVVRYLVMAIMLGAGILDIIKGLGGLHIIPKIL